MRPSPLQEMKRKLRSKKKRRKKEERHMDFNGVPRASLLLGDLLLRGAWATADQDVEGDGVSALAAFLGDDVARLLTLGDELEALKAAAGPVEQTTGSLGRDLRLGPTVLLVAKALRQTAIASAGAEVDRAENGGGADVVPVWVLRSTLSAVGGLDDLGAAWNEELALLLELLGGSLDPLPCADVTDRGALSLANVADALLSCCGDHR